MLALEIVEEGLKTYSKLTIIKQKLITSVMFFLLLNLR